MIMLKEMEAARRRMLAARKTLDEFRVRPGAAPEGIRYGTMSDELIKSTNDYLDLVGRFLQENSSRNGRTD